ncbi:ATP-binding protein [Nonomuraea sp. LPB2021202275-12-8]|uniref:ATP-binding protein n=1 Tax=Nonomuraea sp. LPB2021202275-12-8 TaxID=3120159 RepID=UPI00300C57F1
MSGQFELRCPITYDLGLIRGLIRLYAQHAGLSGGRLENLTLAVNEAITNVLDHAGAAGTVTATSDDSGVTVEIVDLAGTLMPEHLATAHVDVTSSHGFGLWVIRCVCDELTLDHPDGRTRLRMHMRFRPPAASVLSPFEPSDSSSEAVS